MSNIYSIMSPDARVDTIVIDGINGGYAKVKRCPHGNKYYAVLSWHDDKLPNDINHDTLHTAYDTDIDYIPCCG